MYKILQHKVGGVNETIYYPVYNIYIRQGQLVVFVYSIVWRFFNDFFFFFFMYSFRHSDFENLSKVLLIVLFLFCFICFIKHYNIVKKKHFQAKHLQKTAF